MERAVICSVCSTRSPSISLWISHLRQVHLNDSDISLSCPVSECGATYFKVNSLYSHVYRKHKELLSISTSSPATVSNSGGTTTLVRQDNTISSTLMLDFSLPESLHHDVDRLLCRDAFEQKKKSILFLMQLKEERLLTQVAINDVVVGCKEVFSHTLCRIKAGISEKISQTGLDTSSDELCSFFDEMSNPFTGLESAYLQDKFITEELGCIEPLQVQVGRSRYVTRLSGAKRRKILTRDSFYYVPLLSTLKQILQIQSIRQEILMPSKHTDNCLYDLSDGSVFKKHPFFKNHPKGLQIVAYYDEVETCNPLGSSSGKFKLGCVFFTLSNIRPMYRSGLKAIFLLVVAKSSTVKAHGIDSVLKPFLDDLKTLYETGIKLNYNGKEEVWKGALLAFLADNLAAHELRGFKESFSFSKRFCRSCLTDKEQSQEYFREDQFVIRTSESHTDQCNRLDGPDGSKVSVDYGINRRSSLESLPYFSVITGMPHDIMHDLYEGAIPLELKLLIQHCIDESYFQLATVNYRLKAFGYGYSEVGDKPAPIEDVHKLRQTASQMWLLARIFPLLMGDLVPESDCHWDCFLKLLKICEICVAPVLSGDSAAYVEVLIEEHHTEFRRLYPDKSMTPKTHFMVHYSQQILDYGPLIHTWTMRHEAKLRVIKRAARVSNFKNVCQTVAKRHQHLMCYYIHSNMFFSKSTRIGPCKQSTITAFPANVQLLLTQQYKLTHESVLFTTSFVANNGVTFKPDALVLSSSNKMLGPVFSKISEILRTEKGEVIFVLNKLNTLFYEHHSHAYCITDDNTCLHICNLVDLHYNYVFHLRQPFSNYNELYVIYKYIE